MIADGKTSPLMNTDDTDLNQEIGKSGDLRVVEPCRVWLIRDELDF
jgi:hypothetical protein